jgi:hypothetical protein
MCAGEFPGDAPQNTQILIRGGASGLLPALEAEVDVLVIMWSGFNFDRPFTGVEGSRIEGAGDAPPEAIVCFLFVLVVVCWRRCEDGERKGRSTSADTCMLGTRF